MRNYKAEDVEVVVIGGGHAGCEAALASARMGHKTILFSISLDSIAMMPCNPNIGGTSKGHLVREIDALGGEMGKNIDKTFIQSRMLNMSKGPAVYSLRAQADKQKYSLEMKKVLESTENLLIKQNEVIDILLEENKVTGVICDSGAIYNCKTIIICSGTYLKSRILYGETIIESGPNGLKSSQDFSDCLKGLGIKMYRFKTGTPARIDKRSVDFSVMEEQKGDEIIIPFSFENTDKEIEKKQVSCYLTYTNENTHEIIRENLKYAPMYTGVIEGTGARYCPSIEDKVVRFADKERHQIFIEPEGEDTNEMYVQGMSTSLPEDAQLKAYRTIKGLENCNIMRTAYAIEYDCIDATQLKLSLEFKNIAGLFSAGQFNGSSGYEEAAAQGIVAGLNSSMYIKNREAIIIDRSEGYIGVLIDDLVTKGTEEPYRMMTSRAEYRLLLRQDNADLRLTEIGYNAGLIKEERYNKFLLKKSQIKEELKRVSELSIAPTEEVNKILVDNGTSEIIQKVKFNTLLKRPKIHYNMFEKIDVNRPELPKQVIEQVDIQIKYEGFINKQIAQVEQFKKSERKKIPEDIDYFLIEGLRIEAKQKLSDIKPENIGHASRITGVSYGDISVLLIYLSAYHRRNVKK